MQHSYYSALCKQRSSTSLCILPSAFLCYQPVFSWNAYPCCWCWYSLIFLFGCNKYDDDTKYDKMTWLNLEYQMAALVSNISNRQVYYKTFISLHHWFQTICMLKCSQWQRRNRIIQMDYHRKHTINSKNPVCWCNRKILADFFFFQTKEIKSSEEYFRCALAETVTVHHIWV